MPQLDGALLHESVYVDHHAKHKESATLRQRFHD